MCGLNFMDTEQNDPSQASTGGFSIGNLTDALKGLADSAAPVITALKKPAAPTVAKPAVTVGSTGISQTALLIGAGGLTILLVVLMFLRRGK